ncbi:hypothetical protein BBF96_02880 [Anoxybacter fermentans]|uniref:Na/Pi cotransporter n=1 Tax=Anoxybacter fermentans TaxID=1323375 RepID=A0A3Q9HP46_9FIRM|nr:Na/Pi symporter [Anoxybacter fermentans]AZR72430.1 hypothetical protein BBF96_02880 [Anoxybacter fermentans]
MLKVILFVFIGLVVFFQGLHMAEKGLKKGAGTRLKRILEIFTSNLINSIITGTIVTAIIQSSSAVSVMVIGFVSGGVMTLYQGMGVIIGANIGTTMTIHILSLKMNHLEWILCLLGLLLMAYGWVKKVSRTWYSGLISFGFGLIFLGLNLLQVGLSPLQYHPMFLRWLMRFSTQPLLGIVSGLSFTALIQSSSATSGIVLTLARQGMLALKGAIGVILGSNIGTCITAVLAALKTNRFARRIACFHVIFNCFGVLLFIPMLNRFTKLITFLASEPGKQVAIAHTLFNLITAVIILPFIKPLEQLLRDL